jgi:pyrimidine deaminase RibD-like protein
MDKISTPPCSDALYQAFAPTVFTGVHERIRGWLALHHEQRIGVNLMAEAFVNLNQRGNFTRTVLLRQLR